MGPSMTMTFAIRPGLSEPTRFEALIVEAGVDVSEARAISTGRPRSTDFLTAGRRSDGDLRPSDVKQIVTPASFKYAALLGASSQCFSSVRDTKRERNGSLRSYAAG